MWIFYAVLSAVFASITAIIIKLGIQNVNGTLATAIRTTAVLVMAWLMVFVTNQQKGISDISHEELLFLIASGITTGLSWLFYLKAIQLGDISKVVPIDKFSVVLTILMAVLFLGETLTAKTVIGITFITIGTFVLI